MITNEKNLPISINPPITTYEHHAAPLAVISTCTGYMEWFLENYIQIWFSKDFPTNRGVSINFCDNGIDHHAIYFFCPFNWTYLVPNKMIEKYDGWITQFIKDVIDDNQYPCIYLDDHFIPGSNYYNKNNFLMGKLIYGYNEEKQYFKALGFIDGQYKSMNIPYNILELAYANNNQDAEWATQIKIEKRLKTDYNFDIYRTSHLINAYLTSTQSGTNSIGDTNLFGIQCYDYMIEYLLRVLTNETEHDIRPFHLIWEHKKIMVQRIHKLLAEKFIKDDYLLDDFSRLENQALLNRNYFIKYKLNNNPDVINKLINNTKIMRENEELLLTKLINSLGKYL